MKNVESFIRTAKNKWVCSSVLMPINWWWLPKIYIEKNFGGPWSSASKEHHEKYELCPAWVSNWQHSCQIFAVATPPFPWTIQDFGQQVSSWDVTFWTFLLMYLWPCTFAVCHQLLEVQNNTLKRKLLYSDWDSPAKGPPWLKQYSFGVWITGWLSTIWHRKARVTSLLFIFPNGQAASPVCMTWPSQNLMDFASEIRVEFK